MLYLASSEKLAILAGVARYGVICAFLPNHEAGGRGRQGMRRDRSSSGLQLRFGIWGSTRGLLRLIHILSAWTFLHVPLIVMSPAGRRQRRAFESIGNAIGKAVARASATGRGVRWFAVKRSRGQIEGGRIAQSQVYALHRLHPRWALRPTLAVAAPPAERPASKFRCEPLRAPPLGEK